MLLAAAAAAPRRPRPKPSCRPGRLLRKVRVGRPGGGVSADGVPCAQEAGLCCLCSSPALAGVLVGAGGGAAGTSELTSASMGVSHPSYNPANSSCCCSGVCCCCCCCCCGCGCGCGCPPSAATSLLRTPLATPSPVAACTSAGACAEAGVGDREKPAAAAAAGVVDGFSGCCGSCCCEG